MGSLPFSDLALEGSSGIVLSVERIIDVAKEVVHSSPLICDWEHCGTELNSWKTLQEHLHRHCEGLDPATSALPGLLECPLPKCSGRLHDSLESIEQHIDLSHLSRVLLPCPLQDCPLTFGRNAQGLPEHLQGVHRDWLDQRVAEYSPALRPLRKPHPHLPTNPIPLPDSPIPAYIFTPPIVHIRQPQQWRAPTSSQVARRWKRMHVQTSPEEDEEDAPVGPFPDLAPFDAREALAPGLLTVRHRRSEPALQQSRPYMCGGAPERAAVNPPQSIGYSTFAVRFGELEKAGIIDGSGVWPEVKAAAEGRSAAVPGAAGAGPASKKAAARSL
ncbi:uncharacterized protein TRAVEDRAFT_47908 [Trametes versicolor FP-101664 SS1]|uniref:uncharacterized protein n=1 Tax=Trametes versicolor (strain FP-101664) TaxID=717944 RepID=UPI00046218E9|nr:uncharacterized protein TRAVEDRAFT_47908 [Trametes versicolor FP-101664 SS1]EIW58766.1 hypothetical protein TRAVEDRAFT_47908 [Trametes versicolor FP-101664 SS1]